MLLDTGAGISDVVLYTVSLADEVLVVATPEPTSLTDAYATIKVLATHAAARADPAASSTRRSAPAKAAPSAASCSRWSTATSAPALDAPVKLELLGEVPRDPAVREAVQRAPAAARACPGCPAAQRAAPSRSRPRRQRLSRALDPRWAAAGCAPSVS